MPLTRYQSRNEYGLADPDLYQAADKDDPEALLEGVAMAGLVGILRQLGDLAEFAAEMFHDLHEEVMATASRSHGLMARVQQLEVEFPYIEKTLLCQTDHSPFFAHKGEEWHPNVQLEQSVVTRGDLPRCVMDSYEECRGPPRLFLLDKFDISGAGACLKRYTDPSFVRLETSSYEATWDDVQREKKSQKAKRRASHLRNGETPENAVTSHAKLHELFMEEHLETRHSDPTRVVKLKTRKLDGYSLISKSGESYMGKFARTSFDLYSPNLEVLTWNMDTASDVVTDIPEINMVDTREKSHRGSRTEVTNLNGSLIEKDIETVPESTHNEVSGTTITKDSRTNMNRKAGFLQNRSYSEDLTSEADNYVDAPATMESETETEDECRPKNRSEALKDGNNHTYTDVDEERMEDPSQFSFFHSVENTPVSENGQSSFGKQSSSFSYSDTASISIDDQSDGEKVSGRLSSTSSSKSEPLDATSHPTPEANTVSRDFDVQESISSSNAGGQTSYSNDKCSSPRPVSQNAESCSLNVQSLAPEVVETSPEYVRIDPIKGGNVGSEVDPIDSSRSNRAFDVKNDTFPPETSSISSISEGSRYDSTVEKNCMVEYSSNLVNSGTNQTGKQLPVTDNDVEYETNSTIASSKVLANSGSDTKSCDGSSLTGKVLACSPDMPSKVSDPSTVDAIHLEDTLGDETECVAVTNAVADVDSPNSVADIDTQSSVAEISNEHSCAFGTTADISVSDTHEETLENEMSMPAEVDSKLTSDLNSIGETLVEDASPDQISDIPVEFHSSSMHDEGIHDLSGVDDSATDIVPNLELAVSDSDSETSIADVNHLSTSLGSPLPWISSNKCRSSSEAGEISQDIVVESNETLQAENNPESEIKTQESPPEVSSEDLSSALDNNDLAHCESLSPMTSLDQIDRDTETKSPCKSILDDNCIDSSPVNLLESVMSEEPGKMETPRASHASADEELLLSVSRGLEFVPQPPGIELNSPEQEVNLDPTFPSFGLIPEIIPDQEDMPPLPPLPPMQWRVGKAPHSFFPTFMGESVETSSSAPSATPPFGSSVNIPIGSKSPESSVSLGSDKSEQLPEEFVNNASERQMEPSIQFPITGTDLNSQYERSQSADLSTNLPTMPNHGHIENFASEEDNLLADHAAQNHEVVYSQASSSELPQEPEAKYEDLKDDTEVHVSHGSGEHSDCPETIEAKVEGNGHSVPDASSAETAEPSSSSVQKIIPVSLGDAMWPVSAFTVTPTLDINKLEEVPMIKPPQPRSPLVDAVAAHDRRKMKKVSERVHPPIKSMQDDKDSWLAEIRNKSVNLKPAVATRPKIQTGPKTNLRVAAILEKANTIRQAMAGSDEDEDSDSWSDS